MPGRFRNQAWCFAAGVLLAAGGAGRQQPPFPRSPAGIPYEIVGTYPHDATAFTQGLFYEGGFLFEGTGRRGESVLRKTDLETGVVVMETALSDRLFGEGVARHEDRIYQLTWQSGLGFVYDRETFVEVGRFRIPGEGWGLTGDGRHLIMSDGTSVLRFLDPGTLEEVRRIQVRDEMGAVDRLNELEYIDGAVFANVWHADVIVRISPDTGRVTGRIDLGPLAAEVGHADREAVPNGIAFDPDTGHLFVTGKLWPAIFELRLLEDALN